MECFQIAERFVHLPEFSERSLEIVRFQRQILRVPRGLRLLQSRLAAVRVGAAMEHVIPVEGDARAELHELHGGGIVRAHQRPAMVGYLHAAAHFGRQVGAVLIARGHFGALGA